MNKTNKDANVMKYDELGIEESRQLSPEFEMKGKQAQEYTIKRLLKKWNKTGVKEVDEEFKNSIENGICYMLSMEWLRLIVKGNPAWNNEYGMDYDVDENGAYYKQIANNYVAYFSDNGTAEKLVPNWNNKQVAEKLIPLGTGKDLKTKEYIIDPAKDLCDKLFEEGNKYMFIELNMADGGHAVAAYREEKVFYLFDPNFGVIEVQEGNKTELRRKTKILMQWLITYYESLETVVRVLA